MAEEFDEKSLAELKLMSEIEKIRAETREIKSQRRRALVTTFSVIVAIFMSIIGGYETINSILAKNRELEMEARLRSSSIFLKEILPNMEVTNDEKRLTERTGAYAVAMVLAKDFENLKPPIKAILKLNDDLGDTTAYHLLKQFDQAKQE